MLIICFGLVAAKRLLDGFCGRIKIGVGENHVFLKCFHTIAIAFGRNRAAHFGASYCLYQRFVQYRFLSNCVVSRDDGEIVTPPGRVCQSFCWGSREPKKAQTRWEQVPALLG
jgi:hypothetical protein